MSGQTLVVMTTLASREAARDLVRSLVEERLVACGTCLPGGTSLYRWEGAVTEQEEVVVLLKTEAGRWEALAEAIARRHPYAVPELLALPVSRGLERYLSWVADEVAP